MSHYVSHLIGKGTIGKGTLWLLLFSIFFLMVFPLGISLLLFWLNKPKLLEQIQHYFKINTSQIQLTKALFVQDERIGIVRDIKYGDLDPHPGKECVIAGTHGALICTLEGEVIKFVDFKLRGKSRGKTRIIDIEDDGVCEFLQYDVLGSAVLRDHLGNVLWTHKGGEGEVGHACAGDLDGDGIKEIVLCMGMGGLRVLDASGNIRWTLPANFQANFCAVTDVNKDGQNEIVATINGELVWIDGDKKTIHIGKPEEGYFDEFSLVRWPSRNGPLVLLQGPVVGGTSLQTLNGKTELHWFEDAHMGNRNLKWIHLRKDRSDYCVLAGQRHFQGQPVGFKSVQAIVFVYDPNLNLVYEEILPERGGAIEVIPSDVEGEEALLLGGEGRVWIYKFAKEAEQEQSRPTTAPQKQN